MDTIAKEGAAAAGSENPAAEGGLSFVEQEIAADLAADTERFFSKGGDDHGDHAQKGGQSLLIIRFYLRILTVGCGEVLAQIVCADTGEFYQF